MRKRVLSLFMVIVMALSLAAPAFAAKDDKSDLPEYEILSMLPETLQRPTRPTTLEQADLYGHPDRGGIFVEWSDESTLREITELTDSLTAGKANDTQKMKAIFDWVYQNIEYDYDATLLWARWSELTSEQRRRVNEAAEVFHVYTNRRGICEGYSNLCWLMGTIAGIPVAKLTCATSTSHARNAALLDGKWVFFDATEAWNTVDPDYSWDLDPYDRARSYSSLDFYDGVYQMYAYRGYDGNMVVSAALRPGYQYQCPDSVTTPSYVTEVARYAFEGCTNLKSVTILDGVTKIGAIAFKGCANLERVTVADSVTEIGGGAFEGCTSLKYVNIPHSVTEIRTNLFKDCTSLVDITLPNSVTRIWGDAFKGCTSMKSITIPGSVTEMEAAFYGCAELESVTIERGVPSIGFAAFQDCTGLKNITIPDTVTTIEGQAFWGCTALESVTIPEGVTTIEKLAFAECENLKYAALPDSVTSVDGSAFFGCPNLQGVATIPAGMTRIANGMFDGRTDLTSFVIPDHITEIGYWSFRDCTNLKSITIPNSVTVIGNSAFMGCSGLTSITIPSSVTTIEAWAFAGCRGLTSVFIPDSVTEIQVHALAGGNISDVYYGGTEEQWKAIQGDGKDMPHTTIHYNSAGPKPAANTAYPSTQAVTIDGKKVEFQMYALKDANGNDTNYIKLRDVASVLSGTAAQFAVGWDGAVNIETGKGYTPNGSEMKTPFSGNRAYETATSPTNINGQTAALEAIVLKDDGGNGYTYYKLRDLGKALGFNVGWSTANGVFVETGKPYTDAD